ncbi:hypothetical protein CC86DRAFT_457122 [Ophiobolus disseminans]|uniref:Heterokaryon incompatibility domain-containing protein n=1 Tax=Ophiobolus disseminans TaxID=1469910 RepID=A0A6A6ZV31_9PLEO|nr:hypothetical protein CC86DRAFT_457122 [Ophiobolus disseminans]
MEESATAKELRELECDMALAFGWSEHVGPYLPMPTPTSIRLLEVAPGQPFRLSFKIVNLDDLPVYSVLSYTWGNPRGILPSGEDVEADRIAMLAKYPVNCENCVLEVSANCYEFLKWFQTFQQAVCAGWEGVRVFNVSSKHVRYIWVDAICINQHSTKDKNCQVRIMDRVYRQAGKALIWLGAADELTQEGLTTMISFATAAHALRAHKIPKESRSRLIGRPGNSPLLAKLRLPRLGPRQWQAVLSMYRRTWFSRAWTVQEFALAKGSIVVCGDWMNVWSLWSESSFFLMESDWAMILTKMETRKAHNESTIARLKYDGLLGDCPPGQSVTILYDVKDSFFFPLICLRDISYIQREISRQRWTFSKLTFPLQRMLGTLSHSNSSHPADHIYAFLGLVPASSWEGLSIDYNRPTADTFVQTTWAMIKSTKTLSILSFSELKLMGGVKDLPTWVPDYTTRQVMKPLDPGSSFPFAGNPPGYFNASKKSLYNSPIKDTLSRTLIVSGYHQCIIAEVEKRNPLRSPDITEKHEPSKLPSIDWKDVFRFDQSLSMLSLPKISTLHFPKLDERPLSSNA